MRRVGWSTFTASPPLLARLRAEITSVPTQANRQKNTKGYRAVVHEGGKKERGRRGRGWEREKRGETRNTSRFGFGHFAQWLHPLCPTIHWPRSMVGPRSLCFSFSSNYGVRLVTTGQPARHGEAMYDWNQISPATVYFGGSIASILPGAGDFRGFFLIFPEKLAMKLSDTNRSKIWPPVAQGGKAER